MLLLTSSFWRYLFPLTIIFVSSLWSPCWKFGCQLILPLVISSSSTPYCPSCPHLPFPRLYFIHEREPFAILCVLGNQNMSCYLCTRTLPSYIGPLVTVVRCDSGMRGKVAQTLKFNHSGLLLTSHLGQEPETVPQTHEPRRHLGWICCCPTRTPRTYWSIL